MESEKPKQTEDVFGSKIAESFTAFDAFSTVAESLKLSPVFSTESLVAGLLPATDAFSTIAESLKLSPAFYTGNLVAESFTGLLM